MNNSYGFLEECGLMCTQTADISQPLQEDSGIVIDDFKEDNTAEEEIQLEASFD